MVKIAIALAICLASGNECMVKNIRVTEYLPWKGDPMNCMEPCDMTAYMVPVEYGVTAACNGLPWNTKVTFVTPWGERATRWCQDVCPGCSTYHIDVAMPEHDNGRYYGDGWQAVIAIPPGNSPSALDSVTEPVYNDGGRNSGRN